MRALSYPACVIHVTTVRTRFSKPLHRQIDYIKPPNLVTYGNNFVAGNSVVHTRPPNRAWGQCGENVRTRRISDRYYYRV